MEHAARAGGQAGQLWLDRRPAGRRDAIHRGPPLADRGPDARRSRTRHGRLRAVVRRAEHGAGGAAEPVPQPGRQRRRRHRRGHGDEHPAAQPRRSLPGPRGPDRQPRRVDGRTAPDRARPRLPDRRHRDGPRSPGSRLPHRPQHDHPSGPGARRGVRQEPQSDRRHRDPLPADPRRDRGEDRRTRQRRSHQGHLRDPQRERSQRSCPPDPGAEARRRSRRGAQPALPVFLAPDVVLADLSGTRRREAADPVVQEHAGGVPAASDGCDPPPHSAPPRQGPQPQAHARRTARCSGQHRRGDQDHPQFEVAGRGEGATLPASGSGSPARAGPRGRGLRRAPGRAGGERDLRPLTRAGRRHPPAHTRPVGEPRA